MPRNQSVDSKKTSFNLTQYYNEARRKGLVDQILKEGNFQENAIRTAISRGRISINMINAFRNIMNADVEALIGQRDIPPSSSNESQSSKDASIYLTDEEMIRIVKLLVVERNKKIILKEIISILKN